LDCPSCENKPLEGHIPLKAELEQLYHDCIQVIGTRLLYISDLDHNLWKLEQHFREGVALDNPYCTIHLSRPETVDKLNGSFDRVYIDNDILGREELLNALDIKPEGVIHWVEPIKQTIIK
jgi:hypothetical protein